jgi:hypothetical protein
MEDRFYVEVVADMTTRSRERGDIWLGQMNNANLTAN